MGMAELHYVFGLSRPPTRTGEAADASAVSVRSLARTLQLQMRSFDLIWVCRYYLPRDRLGSLWERLLG